MLHLSDGTISGRRYVFVRGWPSCGSSGCSFAFSVSSYAHPVQRALRILPRWLARSDVSRIQLSEITGSRTIVSRCGAVLLGTDCRILRGTYAIFIGVGGRRTAAPSGPRHRHDRRLDTSRTRVCHTTGARRAIDHARRIPSGCLQSDRNWPRRPLFDPRRSSGARRGRSARLSAGLYRRSWRFISKSNDTNSCSSRHCLVSCPGNTTRRTRPGSAYPGNRMPKQRQEP